jgi:hypothetical protein
MEKPDKFPFESIELIPVNFDPNQFNNQDTMLAKKYIDETGKFTKKYFEVIKKMTDAGHIEIDKNGKFKLTERGYDAANKQLQTNYEEMGLTEDLDEYKNIILTGKLDDVLGALGSVLGGSKKPKRKTKRRQHKKSKKTKKRRHKKTKRKTKLKKRKTKRRKTQRKIK